MTRKTLPAPKDGEEGFGILEWPDERKIRLERLKKRSCDAHDVVRRHFFYGSEPLCRSVDAFREKFLFCKKIGYFL